MVLRICDQRFFKNTVLQFGYTLLTLDRKIFDTFQSQVIASSISFCKRHSRCGFQIVEYITISVVE